MQRFITHLRKPWFKKLTVIVGSILAIASIFISINPDPFLRTGYWGVFLYGVLGPVTLIIPVMSQHLNLYLLSFVAALGVMINDTLAYVIGRNADIFIRKNDKILWLESWVNKYGVYALILISISPIPYDFVGLIVGYLDLSYKKYAIPMVIGKFIRYLLIGWGTKWILGSSTLWE